MFNILIFNYLNNVDLTVGFVVPFILVQCLGTMAEITGDNCIDFESEMALDQRDQL